MLFNSSFVLLLCLLTSVTANQDVIVKFKEGLVDDLDNKINEWNLRSGRVSRNFNYAIKGFALSNLTDEEVKQLMEDEDIEYVEEDSDVTLPVIDGDGPGKSLTGQQPESLRNVQESYLFNWGLDRVDQREGLDNSFRYAFTGRGVEVFILDTGVNGEHMDFGNRVSETCFTAHPYEGCTDIRGHGTHVAGIAAGSYSGVAKEAIIYNVKVLDGGGSASWSDVIAGIDWVVEFRGNSPNPAPAVINMSLGGSTIQALNDALTNAIDTGIVAAVSAGNDYASSACYNSPASTPDAITVGSTTELDQRSYFSNIGPCVDIFAPGSDIYSSDSSNTEMVIPKSGTSMASPMVAGVLALYLEWQPDLSPAEVRDLMISDSLKGIIQDVGNSPNFFLYTGNIENPDAPASTPVSTIASTPASTAAPTSASTPASTTGSTPDESIPSSPMCGCGLFRVICLVRCLFGLT